ncbi:hypothetical protein DTL42_23170 [Bremerella cremea]|uniref:SHOCT domain-containing protein n=1 Tax=Bremerella cremea TaxID=1031537 RepID=A0A368KL15_9BACT|nr:hypothetical protein DTL42_23170 [Bremerella cremea]
MAAQHDVIRCVTDLPMEKQYLQLAFAVFLLAVCILGLALTFHLLRKWREYSDEDQQNPDTMLSKFREMHSRGELSDEEFRKITTDIRARIQVTTTSSEETEIVFSEDASKAD